MAVLAAAVLALPMISPSGAAPPAASTPKAATAASPRPAKPPSVVATVGGRTIDALDIQRAAESVGKDPLRKRNPQAWRKSLLNLCVDRELLAMEAERRGIGDEGAVRARWEDREYAILFARLYEQVLVPGISPTPEQLAEIRAGGLYRGIDLNYILVRDTPAGQNKPTAQRILERLRAGARFDSLARIYSGHPPSAAAGGHFGMVFGRDLDPQSHEAVRTAKPGDYLGVYSGPYGHEIYGITRFTEIDDDSLYRLVLFERGRDVYRDHEKHVLRKYHFTLDSTQVNSVLFAAAMEPTDSLLASLGPDGTRPGRGTKPAIGVLARCDVDSVVFPDIVAVAPLAKGTGAKIQIRNAGALAELCGRAMLRELVILDAQDRGLDREPTVARQLRLAREEILTRAMVEQARGAAPDTATLRVYYDKHADRYQRSGAAVALAAVFANPESASAALERWRGRSITDTLLAGMQLLPQPRATAMTLYPNRYATLTLADGAADSMTRAVRGLEPGQRTGVVRTIQGYAVAEVRSREKSRPLTFDEAAPEVRRDWRRDADGEWVAQELRRLRAANPVRAVPGRLEAVKLASVGKTSSGGAP